MFNRIKVIMKSMTDERWFNRHFNNPEDFYSSVEELLGQFGPPYGAADNKIIPNGFFWSSLAINVLLKSREYSANPTQKERMGFVTILVTLKQKINLLTVQLEVSSISNYTAIT